MNTKTKLTLDGIDIFVVSQGTGHPVFILGGPWFGHSYLNQLQSELAKYFRVIAYDPRGSGRSSPLSEDQITLAGHIRDLENLRQELKVDRMNLVGHSMGALAALFYAAEHSAAMESLVLLHPGPPFDHDLQKTLHHAFSSGHSPEDRAALKELSSSPGFAAHDAKTHEEYFKILYSPFFLDRTNISRLNFAFTETTARYALKAEESLLKDILMQNPMDKASHVQCPTAVIHAEHDLIPEAFARQLADAIPHAEYIRLAGVGHFAYLEDSSRSTPPIVDFLTRVTR